ncbi:hypothetical protein Tco_0615488 [Tanacetum coccineum]
MTSPSHNEPKNTPPPDHNPATLNKGQGADHKKVANSSRPNSGDSGSSNSYVNAVKNHKSVDHDSPAIVLDEGNVGSTRISSVKSKRQSAIDVGVSHLVLGNFRQASFDINPDGGPWLDPRPGGVTVEEEYLMTYTIEEDEEP